MRGLAPYWFDVEATGHLGDQGRSAIRPATSYDILLTQKLILQYEKDDLGHHARRDAALGQCRGQPWRAGAGPGARTERRAAAASGPGPGSDAGPGHDGHADDGEAGHGWASRREVSLF
ncbi:hypothetical protein THIX_60361 [Thiomonas sp. X19]|nr:hypothetical protein THIX_60361 [Thiomonas sp. X19]